MRQRRRRDHGRRGGDQSCGVVPFALRDSWQGSPVQFIAVQEDWLKISAWVLGWEVRSLREDSGLSTKTTVERASLSVALGSMTVVWSMPSTGRMVWGSKMWQ